jgi:hypothetical protein
MAKRKAMSQKLRFEVFKRDSFKCQYCGESAPEVILHVDHIKPVVEGGKNELTNLITACVNCNLGKGKRTLEDHTAVEKQKAQLGELNERRLQLEMMMKWREGLSDIEETKFGYANEKWEELVAPYTLNDLGIKLLKKTIKRFSLENVLDSIESSCTQYLETDINGKFTKESVGKAFDYISKICACKKRQEDKPHLKDLYYIRGILKNRLGYINLPQAFSYLEDAFNHGADIESLKKLAKETRNWTTFRNSIENFISDQSR